MKKPISENSTEHCVPEHKVKRLSNRLTRLSRQLFVTRLGLGLLALLTVAVFSFTFWTFQLLSSPISNVTSVQIVELPKGASAKAMVKQLHQAGMLERPQMFTWYLRYHQVAHQLKPGEFEIDPNWNFFQLKQALLAGKTVSYPFTIVPGETLAQIKEKLAQQPNLKKTLDHQAWSSLAKQQLNGNLEGWLLPETYFYHKGETDRDLVLRALRAMQTLLEQEWARRDTGLPIKTSYEALILASIIEKETGAAHERHQISGVFVRRLQRGMRLQTDPTVIYGMGESYQGHIGREGLDTVTPYNTYRIKGLPPTPIAMPSKEAVHAAMHPDDSDALYFVSKGNGEHYFSSNLNEHNRAVRQYILNKSDGSK